MSEERAGYSWITLSYFPTFDKSLAEVTKDCQSMVKATKRYCKEKGIAFTIFGCISPLHYSDTAMWEEHVSGFTFSPYDITEEVRKNENRLHVHLIMYATKRNTAEKFVCDWWCNKHNYGKRVTEDKAGKETDKGTVLVRYGRAIGDLQRLVDYVKGNYYYATRSRWIKVGQGENIRDCRLWHMV